MIARRVIAHGLGLAKVRWVAERTFAWLHQFKRLHTRYERRADLHQGLLTWPAAPCVSAVSDVRSETTSRTGSNHAERSPARLARGPDLTREFAVLLQHALPLSRLVIRCTSQEPGPVVTMTAPG
jgi:hypothetical protein